jgi:hypothetical protein
MSQTTCTLEKLVFKDKQVGFEIKEKHGYWKNGCIYAIWFLPLINAQ